MVTVNLIAGCPTPPECLVVFHFNKLSKLGRVLREHIKFVWTGGTNSNADTCHFFFFFKTCNLYSDAESNCHKWKQRKEAQRSPPSQQTIVRTYWRRRIRIQHTESSPERKWSQNKKKVSPLGLLCLMSLILWAFSGISLSHEQPRAAGQGAGLWANTTLQRPIEELVKAVKSLCLETRHHWHLHHTSPCVTTGYRHRLTSPVQKVPSSSTPVEK